MTDAVLDRPETLFAAVADAERAAAAADAARDAGRHVTERGRVTLEERLTTVLRAARTDGSTDCVVCGARMTASGDGAAECRGCGARLS